MATRRRTIAARATPPPPPAAVSSSAPPLYFYGYAGEHGCFSQFFACQFREEDESGGSARVYTSAEQYMMAAKARAMGDAATLRKILAAESPAQIKTLGRQVAPWVEAKWVACRFER